MTVLSEVTYARSDPNVSAFLRVIRTGESSATSDDAYRALYGWRPGSDRLVQSFADHPRQYTQLADGRKTSAAGAYQATATTWDDFVRECGKHDFTSRSQDLFAVWCIRRRKALDDVIAGRVEDALRKCQQEWTSLPGAAESNMTLAKALEVYKRFGGRVAGEISPESEKPRSEPDSPPAAPSEPIPTTTPAGEGGPQEPYMASTAETVLSVAKTALTVLNPIAGALAAAFEPLAREKLEKELARHTDKPEVAVQVSDAIIAAAKQATGKADPVDAVSDAKRNPEIVAQAQQSALDELDKFAPLLERLDALDSKAFADEEASRAAAAARAHDDGDDMAPKLADRAFVVYMTVFASTLALIGLQIGLSADHKPAGELVGFFIAIATLGAKQWEKLFDYRFGSSRGSNTKNLLIDRLSQRGK